MKIGIASENRILEKRVILLPTELKKIANGKNDFLIEINAGKRIGISNEKYERAGGKIAPREEVYNSDLIVRLKEPNVEELKMMHKNAILMSMMHLKGNHELRQIIENSGIVAIPLENIKDDFNERKVEVLKETGMLGMRYGFRLLKKYKQKNPKNATVKIMGYGKVAYGAIQEAARNYAHVEILNKKQIYQMEKHLPGTDILVNGLNWPHELRGKILLIKKEMLQFMEKGSVICDLISNPKGQSPIETMHPTSLDNLDYIIDGIVHTSCWGWPGLNPKTISEKYSKQVAPIIEDIAKNGLENCSEYIRRAVWKKK